MKLTNDILIFTKGIIINNETGKINNIKQITEKEITLYYSDLIIIQKCVKIFVDQSNNSNISKNLMDILNSLKKVCCDIIIQLVSELIASFILNLIN